MADLKISAERPEKGYFILRLTGEFEGLSIVNLREKIMDYLKEKDVRNFMVDFSGVTYIDSTGVGLLIEMARVAADKQATLGLINLNDNIKKVLVLTKVDKILKIYAQ